MGRAADYLSLAQFDLLRWVADGCKDGVYTGTAYRVSARALHNRGFLRVSGKGRTWTAKITPKGSQRLKDEAKRAEAERKRLEREERLKAEREHEQQLLRDKAIKLLSDVMVAGGRLDLGKDADSQDVQNMRDSLAHSTILPKGQRLAQEPTRMDPTLGITVYLEPDFEALTALRSFKIPRQLRNPHPMVAAFQSKKALVSKGQIGRAARFLQALVTAADELGWKAPLKRTYFSGRSGDTGPDLTIQLPSQELSIKIRELDQRGRRSEPYITESDYYTRTERTVANQSFQSSGRLKVTVSKVWQDQLIFSLQDTEDTTLEDQLPVLIRKLEIAEAEADWSGQEADRRSQIREIRWKEIEQEAFTKLTYQRNTEQLHDQLKRRQAVAEMRVYAQEIEAQAEQREEPEKQDALKWATWIRQYADRADPIIGPLRPLNITSAKSDELEPYMNGWSAYGPYRR